MTKLGGWPPSGFGGRLRVLREARQLTRKQLADLVGCHVTTIGSLERMEQEPSWALAIDLAKALGVELTEFVPAKRTRGPKGEGQG